MIDTETGEIITPTNGEFLLTCWQPPAVMTFDQWQKSGLVIKGIKEGINFWLGDWLNYGRDMFGEDYAQAAEDTGYSKSHLVACQWVADKVAPELRRDPMALSWSHHRAVSNLEPYGDELSQDSCLQYAYDNNLTVKELEAHIRQLKGELPAGDGDDTPEEESDPAGGDAEIFTTVNLPIPHQLLDRVKEIAEGDGLPVPAVILKIIYAHFEIDAGVELEY